MKVLGILLSVTAICEGFTLPRSSAFAVTKSTTPPSTFRGHSNLIKAHPTHLARNKSINKNPTTLLRMSYLPPSNDDSGIKSIITPIVTVAALLLFFASPLGGIFFAITNSIFLIVFLTPVLLIAGFQVWSALNTVKGPCPSCQEPVVALKEGEPTLCLNCGSMVRATRDQKGLELCGRGLDELENNGGFFDLFDGGGGGGGVKKDDPGDGNRLKKERTVIDVDFQKDDF